MSELAEKIFLNQQKQRELEKNANLASLAGLGTGLAWTGYDRSKSLKNLNNSYNDAIKNREITYQNTVKNVVNKRKK